MKKSELVEEFIVDVPVLKHAKVVHPVYVLDVKFVVFQIAAARLAMILLRMQKIRALIESRKKRLIRAAGLFFRAA